MQIFVSSLFLSYGSQFTSHNLPLFKSVILVIDGSNRAIDHAKKLTKEFDVYSFCVYISVRLTLDRPNIETQCRRGADTGALCRPHHRLWHMTLMTQWAPCHGNIGRYVSEILISPYTASCHSVSLVPLARLIITFCVPACQFNAFICSLRT